MTSKHNQSAKSDTANLKPLFQTDAQGQSNLVDGWQKIAIEKLGEVVGSNRALRVFLDSCVKCGACTDKCHYYLGSGDLLNMPVARQDLIRGVYRRHYTAAGKLFPKLVGGLEMTEQLLEDWSAYYYQCSECRRCSVYCPFGIDTAEITMAGRHILEAVGLRQKYIHTVLGTASRVGNNLGLIGPAIADTLDNLGEEVFEDTQVPVRFPLDEQGADILLVVPSADLFAEPHVDGLIGCAKIFHHASLSWTLSTEASEAANFGLFVGDESQMQSLAQRIADAAAELGVQQVVIGECGHAWRVASLNLEPRHICEVTHQLLEEGRLQLQPDVHADKVITFHDSCNVARASRMGNSPRDIYAIPRALLQASCTNFVDMAPETICEFTYCCGAGGGLLTDELMKLRIAGASPRVEALERVIQTHGVTHMAAICAICKSQFRSVLPHYDLGDDMIVSLHQIVGDAIVLRQQP